MTDILRRAADGRKTQLLLDNVAWKHQSLCTSESSDEDVPPVKDEPCIKEIKGRSDKKLKESTKISKAVKTATNTVLVHKKRYTKSETVVKSSKQSTNTGFSRESQSTKSQLRTPKCDSTEKRQLRNHRPVRRARDRKIGRERMPLNLIEHTYNGPKRQIDQQYLQGPEKFTLELLALQLSSENRNES